MGKPKGKGEKIMKNQKNLFSVINTGNGARNEHDINGSKF